MSTTPGPAEARLIVAHAVAPAFQVEHVLTSHVITAVPADRATFKPEDGARTAGQLARHIVTTELRFIDGVIDGGFREVTDLHGAPEGGQDLIDYYRTHFALSMEVLETVPDEHLVRLLNYRGVIQMPALGFLQLAMNHSIHHRGQLSVSLREMGLPVPRIYG